MNTLDAKTLSEFALALCLAGAVVVWVGLRLDRYIVRWIGMAVIVVGLLGLIFQGSLTHQTLAAPQSTFSFPTAPVETSPSFSPTTPPSPSPSKKPAKKPPKKKPASTGGSGGYTPPAPPAPQPNPPGGGGGGGGGTPPFSGSPMP